MLPFDRGTEQAAAKELKAQEAADAKAERMNLFRNAAIGVLVLLALVLAWLAGPQALEGSARRRRRTSWSSCAATRPAATRSASSRPRPPRCSAWRATPRSPEEELREELVALVESQPEDVAALLRGWLVER